MASGEAPPLRVVIADDSPESRALARAMLGTVEGVDLVGAAADGAEAVDLVAQQNPDLVLLDIAMPVMDGLEAAAAIRTRSPQTKIAMYSAYSRDRMGPVALAAGADDYFEKAATLSELVARIQRLFPDRTVAASRAPRPARAGVAGVPVHTAGEQRYRLLLDALDEGVLTTDSAGLVSDANFSATQILRTPVSRILGHRLPDLGLDFSRAPALDEAVRRQHPVSGIEYVLTRSDGERRDLLVSVRPLHDPASLEVHETLVSFVDLTEAKRTERLYRHIVEAAQEGIGSLDAEDRTAFVNARFAEMVGSAPEELIGSPVLDHIAGGSVADLRSGLERRRLGRSDSYEVELRCADGTTRWVILSASPMTDEAGRYAGSFVMVTDIDDRKRAEQQLQAAIASMQEAFFLTRSRRDASGRIVDLEYVMVNAEASRVAGRPAEELVGHGLLELYPAHGPTGLFDRYCAVVETGEPYHGVFDYDFETVKGTFEVTVTKVGDGYLMIGTDVTGRRRVEEELRRSEELFRGGFDHSLIGMMLANLDGTFARVNAAFAQMLGYSTPDDLVGVHFLAITHPDDEAESLAGMQQMLAGEPYRTEKRYLRRDGSIVHVDLASTTVCDGDGEPVMFFTQVVDITERLGVERAVAESERRLRDTVDALAEGLAVFTPVRDAQGRVVDFRYEDINAAGCRLTGATRSELVGHRLGEVRPWQRTSGMLEVYAHAVDSGESFELSAVPMSGEWLPGLPESRLFDIRGVVSGPYLIAAWEDVTERAKADVERRATEEALAASEQRYRLMLDTSHEGVVTLDADDHVTYVNDRAAIMFRRPREDFIGLSVLDLVIPEARADALQQLAERRTGQVAEFERQLLRGDGTLMWAILAGSPLYDPDGTYRGSLAVVTDITERKEAEQALAQREQLYRVMIDTSLEGILTNDADNRITYANDRAVQMLRRTREELIGLPVVELVTEDSRADAERQLAARRAGKAAEYERRYLRGDGSTMWAIVNGSPLFAADGNYRGALVMITDITERKEAERALLASEQRLRSTFDALMEGLTIFAPVRDDQGRVVDFVPEDINAAGLRLTRLTRDEFVGHPLVDTRPWYREVGLFDRYLETFESGKPCVIEALPVPGTWTPGTPETRLFEIHLIKSGDRILQVWREVTAETRAKEAAQARAGQLERANRDLDAFASSLSHDLREPLRSTGGFLELIDQQCRSGFTADVREYFDYALAGVDRMNDRITAILDFARSGAAAAPPHAVDARTAARTALRDLADLQRETGAHVEIGELPIVQADEVQLQRVFQNLLSNAARYHRPGVPPAVSVTATPAGALWQLVVADDGTGVPERMRERIFAMFTRGDAGDETAGHGMGLALCRRIVDSYGGQIWVEDNPGGGSRFCFTLPASET